MHLAKATAAIALAVAANLALATPTLAQGKPGGCPPGLAKKNNGCMPPGLAKGGNRDDRRHIDSDYVLIRDPDRYWLRDGRTYYRLGDEVYLVEEDTREIIEFVGAAAALLD